MNHIEDDDDDLSILPIDQQIDDYNSQQYLPVTTFRYVLTSEEDVDASRHALSVAYESLKNRYNELNQQYRMMARERAAQSRGSRTGIPNLIIESSRISSASSSSNMTMGNERSPVTAGYISESEKHKQVLARELDKMQKRNQDLERLVEELRAENKRLNQELQQLQNAKLKSNPVKGFGDVGDLLPNSSNDTDDVQQLHALNQRLMQVLQIINSLKNEGKRQNNILRSIASRETGLLPSLSTVNGQLSLQCEEDREEQVATISVSDPINPDLCNTSDPLLAVTGKPQLKLDEKKVDRLIHYRNTGQSKREFVNDGVLNTTETRDIIADENQSRRVERDAYNPPDRLRDFPSVVERSSMWDNNEQPTHRARGLGSRSYGGLNELSSEVPRYQNNEYELTNMTNAGWNSTVMQNNGLVVNISHNNNDVSSYSTRPRSENNLQRLEQICPVCRKKFDHLNIEDFVQHVNDCIDAKESSMQDDGDFRTLINNDIDGRNRNNNECTVDNIDDTDGIRQRNNDFNQLDNIILDGNSAKNSNDERQQCEDCGKTFDNVLLFLQHRYEHEANEINECAQCGGIFPTRETYHQHLILHEQQNLASQEQNVTCQLQNINDGNGMVFTPGRVSRQLDIGANPEQIRGKQQPIVTRETHHSNNRTEVTTSRLQCPMCTKVFDAGELESNISCHVNAHFAEEDFVIPEISQ